MEALCVGSTRSTDMAQLETWMASIEERDNLLLSVIKDPIKRKLKAITKNSIEDVYKLSLAQCRRPCMSKDHIGSLLQPKLYLAPVFHSSWTCLD